VTHCENQSKKSQIASKNEVLRADSLRFSHLNLMYHYIGMMIGALISFKLLALRRVPAEHDHGPRKYSTPDPDALKNYPALKLSEL